MKKYIQLILMFTSISFFAQKVVADVTFSEDKAPLQLTYLPTMDRVVVQSGLRTNKVYGNIIKDISSYTSDGFEEKLISGEELVNCIFSPIENAFLIAKKPENNKMPEEYKLILNSKPSKYFKLFTKFRYFNDVYGFNIVNQKDDYKIDLQKDDIYLNVVEIFLNTTQKYKLQKPDLLRLQNKFTAEYKEGVNFDVRINENNIGFITKSINKNYKSAALYRTIYGVGGTLINDLKYQVEVPKNFLIYSNNGGGTISQDNETVQISDLAINNFVVDKKTEDVYVYGLFGNEGKTSNNLKNIPLGIYVFKFDKSGKLLWQSVQEILDVTGFNQPQEVQNINLGLNLRENDLIVYVSSFNKNGYCDFVTLETSNGDKKIDGKLKEISKVNKSNSNSFINSDIQITDFSNKNIDIPTFLASQINSSVASYLKNVNSKNILSFKTYVSKKGFWVIETDNRNYYKVLFFS